MKKAPILSKTIFLSYIINIVQLIIITCLIILHLSDPLQGTDSIPLIILIIITLTNSVISIRYVYTQRQTSEKNQMLTESISQIEALNKSLRSQRHDFINHLQVVHSLIEFEEYHETKNYIEKIYSDIQKISKVMRTSKPAINALLQAKLIYCEKQGIVMDINIHSTLEKLSVPPWELCRVLGNLIDNSAFALKETSGEKHIEVNINEDIKFFTFRVIDNGCGISSELSEKIFETGFTTKGSLGQGMGLSIVKEILETMDGSISLSTSDGKTCFTITLPKSNMKTELS